MSAENLKLIQAYYEAWMRGDVDALDEYCAPDLVAHDPATGPDFDLAGLKQRLTALREQTVDQQITSEDWLADRDLVAFRWRSEATLKRTGERVDWTGITIYRVRDGRIAELWHQWDSARLLGALAARPDDAERRSA